MTTTSHLQSKPDYYATREDCLREEKRKIITNTRYRGFDQTHFTAGDIEQFQEFRNEVNGKLCFSNIDLSANIFRNLKYDFWAKYANANALSTLNTFKYLFYKFKKGIFVKILNGKLNVFLPFSNASFENEWSANIQVNSQYKNLLEFLEHVSIMEGRRFNAANVNGDIKAWYGNNCLVRYEYPINEGDSNVSCVKNMLEELCESREIPDMEFFINKRDFPVITRDETEAYNHLWNSEDQPLVSHNYESYLPILSMSVTNRFADILMVTWDDWMRVQSEEGKFFGNKCIQYDSTQNTIPWKSKKPTAVFRGGTTGCGTTIETNMRLKASHISAMGLSDENGIPYLDAGIHKWNLRPRKNQNSPYLKTIELSSLTFGLSKPLTPLEQASYKYILNIDGHVSAFRLSLELSLGSVILLVKSNWKLWYSDMLKPYVHYVPIEADLSDLIEKIKWCRNNDDKCEQIAQNARDFYRTYLSKKSILDYMQKILVDAKRLTGIYAYNTITPLQYQISLEKKFLAELKPPETTKAFNRNSIIPYKQRTHSLLKGLEYVVTLLNKENAFDVVAQYKGDLFKSKTSIVRRFDMANFAFAVKSTSDRQKMDENIHETFVGLKCTNTLSTMCPNFAYIFGTYNKDNAQHVIVEHIEGTTFGNYINSRNFDFKVFLSILLQLSASLCVAQQQCSFVHYDLAPWNIMLKSLEKEEQFDYVLNVDQVLRVRTNIIPVIIDFGKAHVIHDDNHYGFTQMYKTSRIQDILNIVSNCLHELLLNKDLTTTHTEDILQLSNFISGTDYRRDKFTNIPDLRKFLTRTRKYFTMLYSDKHQLENLTPYSFIKYINKMFGKKYKLNFGSVKDRKEYANIYTGRQIFDFILSNSTEERLSTFLTAIQRMKGSTMLIRGNKFETYYGGQTLITFLQEIQNNMEKYRIANEASFTTKDRLLYAKYVDIYKKSVSFTQQTYTNLIAKTDPSPFVYDKAFIEQNTNLALASYTRNTFLLPNVVRTLLTEKVTTLTNPSQFFYTVVFTLSYTGQFALSSEDRQFYEENFKILLSTNPTIICNNIANYNTLRQTAHHIYSLNIEAIRDDKCDKAKELIEMYQSCLD